jgi:hypothetical protein
MVHDCSVFIDWCSLYQSPRSESEEAIFTAALRRVNIWYAHPMVWVFRITAPVSTPAGDEKLAPAYDERGWPSFEKEMSELLHHSTMVLDISKWEEFKTYYRTRNQRPLRWQANKYDLCKCARSPPMLPDDFRTLLQTKTFTHSEDGLFLANMYEKTFRDMMASVESLQFTALGWTDEEVTELAKALPQAPNLKRLDLFQNKIGTVGASKLAAVLHQCELLEFLDLTGNRIPDSSATALYETWSKLSKPSAETLVGLHIGNQFSATYVGSMQRR